MKINIVDTLLGHINEYVNIDIYDVDTCKVVSSYNGSNEIEEEYLGCEVRDFVIDNGLVTIWIKRMGT